MWAPSWLTNLLSFCSSVSESVDNGQDYDVTHLDFNKASDMVPQQRLIRK